MATSYTSILKLALPATGELSGTWGDVVNQNITSMVEEAIAGLATINTWSGASHTLTTANGTTSESRCAILELSGTPGAAATVICPNATKIYIVRNGVNGGFAATIKTAAGTGVTIPNGKVAAVYCDGTDVKAATEFFSTVDIDGGTIDGASIGATTPSTGAFTSLTSSSTTTLNGTTIPASATLTKTADKLNVFAATTSAELAGVVSDETGTGSLVFAGSPALTGTPTAPTAAAGTNTTQVATTAHVFAERTNTATLTNKTLTSPVVDTPTISGGTINNTTVGATTPSTGAFTSLSSTSTTTLNGTTVPASKTLVTTVDTQTLTNKTISVDDNTVSGIAASSFVLSNGSGNIDGSAAQKAIPAGVVVGTTDTQTLTNKTITGSFTGPLTGNASTATALQTARTINGVSFDGSANITITANTPNTLTRGTYLTGNNFNGSAATTWAVDATTTNTASKVVARDASGNFSAGTITATLSGNASTATALQTARTIGGISFDGTANINLPGVNTTGNQNTTGSAASLTTARLIGGVSFDGTANINLPGVNTTGNQNTTGSAATLTTARTINGTSFDGSANITTANWGTARTLWGQSVDGSANITTPLRPAAGSVSAPAFSTSGDTNTGIFFPAADTIAFTEGGSEAMRITSDGRLTLNTTTGFLGARFSIAQAGASAWAQAITLANDSFGTAYTNTSGTTGYLAIGFYNNGQTYSDCGTISVAGTSVTYATSSDYRLKENVQPMQNALDKVAQLKPCTYTWKSTGEDGQGFIAHELQAICPDAVTGQKDAVDKDGKPVYQGVDTSFLVATLTAAIQELKTELDAVKTELETLKGN